MLFRQLFEKRSSTYSYLLADPKTQEALLIDPVRETLERDCRLLQELGLKLRYTVETHVHADHVTSAFALREQLGAKTIVPKRGGPDCGDLQVADGELIECASIRLEVRSTPGHTDGCTSYYLKAGPDHPGMVFTGDALMIRGCGRTDFQAGDAALLYKSVHEKLFSLPEETFVYPGHDYRGQTVSTIAEEKRLNPRLGGGKTEAEFVQIMQDLKLAMPKQIIEALPANLACGREQASPFAPASGQKVAQVSPAWVASSLRMVKLIDLRSESEVQSAQASIPTAQRLDAPDLEKEVADWDRVSAVVLVCAMGQRSLDAAAKLQEMGFERVASMQGGMAAYVAEDLPLVDR